VLIILSLLAMGRWVGKNQLDNYFKKNLFWT
jgi:hypothetical protein